MSEKYPLALPEGTVLAGKYILEDVLGQGGFGITYRAREYETEQKVAIKEYFPESMVTRTAAAVTPFSDEMRENFEYGKSSFLQEAETLAEFQNVSGIVHVMGYFEENATAYFVMEYVEGQSLENFIRQKGGKLDFATTESILLPVMDALAQVHDKGIIHRDVTPDNIFITQSGEVKLIDFGAARYSLGDKSKSLDIVLKHGFAPKEQYSRHGKQGAYTDVYALGATFYFALTGHRPPDSIDRLEKDEMVKPSEYGANITETQESAILMALAVQPEMRFQGMRVFKNALGNVKSSETPKNVNPAEKVSPVQTSAPSEILKTENNVISLSVVGMTGNDIKTTTSTNGMPVKGLQNTQAEPKKKRKIWPIFVIVGGVVIAAAAVLIVLNVKWSSVYKQAESDYLAEKYDAAIKGFSSISFYKDAEKRATYAENMKSYCRNYEEAENSMESGDYDRALFYYQVADEYQGQCQENRRDALERVELLKDMFSYEESGNIREAHKVLISDEMGLSKETKEDLEEEWHTYDYNLVVDIYNNLITAYNENTSADRSKFYEQLADTLYLSDLKNLDLATAEFLNLMNAKSGREIVNRLELPEAEEIQLWVDDDNNLYIKIDGTDITY